MCASEFAIRVLAHPIGGSFDQQDATEARERLAEFSRDAVCLDVGIPVCSDEIDPWRPIGAVVWSVLAKIIHGQSRPQSSCLPERSNPPATAWFPAEQRPSSEKRSADRRSR